MSYNSSSRGGAQVRLVVVHSAEGARTAESLGAFFWDSPNASSHAGIDGSKALLYVPYHLASWTLRNGNAYSDNAELCGFARWTREQWMSTGVVDGVANPLGMLNLTAVWINYRCTERGIPIRKLTPAEVAGGAAGVCGHWDYTIGTGDGSHTDPGAGFPWDYVMNLAAGGDDVDAEAKQWIFETRAMLFGGQGVSGTVGTNTVLGRIDRLERLSWLGGPVTGVIADGTAFDDLNKVKADVTAMKTDIEEIKALLQQQQT